MTFAEFLSEFERVSSQPAGSLRGDEKLNTLKGWNSMAAVELMVLADSELGLRLEPSQIVACGSVKDLAALCGVDGAVSAPPALG